ncbi:RHS repeat-associated core domain-containing protein [Methylobacterium nonmethylotrophicum]|nr:RHS repeat-associated core domain-containing protein [Methylobacterium nonmethylotrophicum]
MVHSAGGSRNGNAIASCDAGEALVDGDCVRADRTSPAPPAAPICPVGNPIDPVSGAKTEYYLDFSADSSDGMKLERFYNSDFASQSDTLQRAQLGYGWRTNFDVLARLGYDGGGWFSAPVLARFYVVFTNGIQVVFKKQSDGSWVSAYYNGSSQSWTNYTEKTQYNLVNVGQNYELSIDGQNTWVFNSDAKLTQIRYSSGYVQNLTYDGNGKLSQASDNRGVSLTFHVSVFGHLQSVDTPAGTISYSYANKIDPQFKQAYLSTDTAAPNTRYYEPVLQTVTFPGSPATTLTYHYEDTVNRFALTGITDQRGIRYATFSYDSNGRAIQTKHIGEIDKYTLTYNVTNGQNTVTNPLGKVTRYNFSKTAQGRIQLSGIQGDLSQNCPASARAYSYDTGGAVASETDEEGRVTAYIRDARGRPISITRGSGTPQATTTTITWHATLNLPAQVVEPGLTTDFTYSATGQLTQLKQTDTTTQTVPFSTQGRTRIWTYTYATGGLLASVDGPLAGTGDTVAYTYSSTGALQTITNELGQVATVTAWSPRGQPTSITGIDGVVTTYTYDDQGRVTRVVINPGSSQTVWTMTYTAAGDLASYSEPAGATYTLTWDDARRLTRIQNNLGEAVTYGRDVMGNVTGQSIVADDGSTQMFGLTNSLDELGRLIRQVGGEGRTWKFGYDKTGNLTGVTDPRNKSVGYGFDAVGRLISETERDGGVVKHAYDGNDEESTYTDPRNLATAYIRNGFGEVIQETSPDRGTTVYDYDTRGLMISKKDARNITVTYGYDAAGRLTSRSYPTTSLNESFTYDGAAAGAVGKGRLTRMQDAGGSSDFYYDAAGRVTGEVRTVGGYSHTVAYGYDATGTGRLRFLTYPSGRVVVYGYDALGRVNYVGLKASANGSEQVIASWAGYFPFGPLRGFSFGNGLNSWSNRSLEYKLDGLFLDQASGGPSLIERYHWWGDDGLNLQVLNNDSIDPAQTQRFSYDDAERLVGGTGPWGALSWTYDTVGNRLSEARSASGTTTTQTYAYPSGSNRLSGVSQGGTAVRSFLYDAAGSLTSDTKSGATTAYTISAAGRIAQVTVGGVAKANYLYDGKNRLSVRQTLNMTPSGTQHLIHDVWDHVLVETNGAGQAVREYIWVGDIPVAVVDSSAGAASPTLLWVHVDHLGRPELMTDATKAVKWKAVYEPFGAVSSITGPAALQMRFPGQWFQLEAGLAYNWNRHYDATTGRYTQVDPLGLPDGPSRYAYAGGNPIGYVDQNGEFFFIPSLLGAGIGALTDVGFQLVLNGGEFKCVDWGQVGVSAGLGALGGGLGSLTRRVRDATEFSHWIPARYVRPLSRSGKNANPYYMPSLDVPIVRDFVNSTLNGNYVSPSMHALTDPYRHLTGMTAADKLHPALQQLLRIPGWLGGSVAGSAAGSANSAFNKDCTCSK